MRGCDDGVRGVSVINVPDPRRLDQMKQLIAAAWTALRPIAEGQWHAAASLA